MALERRALKHTQAGLMLLAIAVIMFIFAAVIAGMLMRAGSDDKQGALNAAMDGMTALGDRLKGFVSSKRRLPTAAEYQALANGVTDALGKAPLYLVDSTLTTLATPLAICALPSTVLMLRDCGGNAACATYTDTANLGFVLVSGGLTAASAASTVSQTTSRTANTAVSAAEVVTRYAPGTLAPDFGTTGTGTVPYDDLVLGVSLADLKRAANCPSETQGAIVEKGTEVRFLNQQTVLPTAYIGVSYVMGYDFSAYGSPDASYSWSVTGLPPGLSLAAVSGQPSRATVSGTPNAGTAGNYSVAVTVTTTLNGKSVQATKLFSLLVTDCATLVPTGATRTSTCPSPQLGTFDEQQMRNVCTGALEWQTTANNCTLPPATVDQSITSAALTAAGVGVGNRNTGLTSFTLGTTTISAGPSGAVISLIGTNANADAIGVAANALANTGYEVSGVEALSFAFSTTYQSASIIFRALGRTPPSGYERAAVTFYGADGVTPIDVQVVSACSVNNQNNNTAVRFSNLRATGNALFKRVDVMPVLTSDFYVGAFAACASTSCQATGAVDADC